MLFGMDSGIIGGVLTMDTFKRFVSVYLCIGSGSSLTVEQEIRSGKPKQSRRRQSFRQYRFDIAGRMLCGRSNSITCLR